MVIVYYIEYKNGTTLSKKFNSPYLAERFIRKIRFSKKVEFISAFYDK